MKKIILLFVIIAICVISCKTVPKFSDVSGKEWKLTDVRLDGKSINFDRTVLESDGFADIFTLNFDAERLSGAGASNRYLAPYTLGKNQAISVQMAGETQMAPLRQPEKLKEYDFFIYIQNAYQWSLVDGNLELSSKGEDGGDVVLVFAL